MMTLGDALPLEMARIRDTVMPFYQGIGLGGTFALMTIRHALDGAAQVLWLRSTKKHGAGY